MENIKKYFEDYPNSNQCFETSDGQLFHQDGDAGLHAKSLDDKKIGMHIRGAAADETENDDENVVDTIPVITAVTVHDDVAPPLANSNPVAQQAIQPAVTNEVAEQLAVAAKATGEAVTDTSDVTDAKPEGEELATGESAEKVVTGAGNDTANSNLAPGASEPAQQPAQPAAKGAKEKAPAKPKKAAGK